MSLIKEETALIRRAGLRARRNAVGAEADPTLFKGSFSFIREDHCMTWIRTTLPNNPSLPTVSTSLSGF